MITNKLHYPMGLDCVWIAMDRNGNVGAFVTAGIGPIPRLVLLDSVFSCDRVEQALFELPRTSVARLAIDVKRPDDFIGMAERGLFVYDWRDAHRIAVQETRAYERIAFPEQPLIVDRLEGALGTLAKKVPLDSVMFTTQASIDARSLGECLDGSEPTD